MRALHLAPVGVSLLLACGARLVAAPEVAPDYLRFVAFEAPGHEYILLRWPVSKMPLRVYLPPPPEALFQDPDAVLQVTRQAVLSWSDAAGPSLPSFEFVESAAQADIPIAWAEQAPTVSVAHCFYNINIFQRRFGVAQVLVTARYRNGSRTTLEDLSKVMLHEMGHALGLGGHSPNPEDAMYGFIHGPSSESWLSAHILPNTSTGLTERDRATLRALYSKPIGARQGGHRRAY